MRFTTSFGRLIGGVLAAGALTATLGTSAALADGGHGRGRPNALTISAGAATNQAERGAEAGAERHGIAGALTKIDGTKLTLATENGESVVIVTNDSTKFMAKHEENFTLADLVKRLAAAQTSGKTLRIAVQGEPSVAGLVANHVVVAGAKEQEKGEKRETKRALVRTEGKITVLTATDITVQPATGNAVTFKVTPTTEIVLVGAEALATGQTATVVTRTGSSDAVRIHVRVA